MEKHVIVGEIFQIIIFIFIPIMIINGNIRINLMEYKQSANSLRSETSDNIILKDPDGEGPASVSGP